MNFVTTKEIKLPLSKIPEQARQCFVDSVRSFNKTVKVVMNYSDSIYPQQEIGRLLSMREDGEHFYVRFALSAGLLSDMKRMVGAVKVNFIGTYITFLYSWSPQMLERLQRDATPVFNYVKFNFQSKLDWFIERVGVPLSREDFELMEKYRGYEKLWYEWNKLPIDWALYHR